MLYFLLKINSLVYLATASWGYIFTEIGGLIFWSYKSLHKFYFIQPFYKSPAGKISEDPSAVIMSNHDAKTMWVILCLTPIEVFLPLFREYMQADRCNFCFKKYSILCFAIWIIFKLTWYDFCFQIVLFIIFCNLHVDNIKILLKVL